MQHFSDWQGAHSIDAKNVMNKRIGVGERGGIQEGLYSSGPFHQTSSQFEHPSDAEISSRDQSSPSSGDEHFTPSSTPNPN